ncbi:hypothetical protein P167DRAFT_569082 [Morchella conica CCBAS932]|uniref:Uncharacterized protein n=1 Tax=Morchella conica CCBAS932 TaxID=1392247 RepID=A0A3N4K7T2_9PEZI|nr:hypothetical protein P167DRAFT_569082 [Morchella conica CCBAS932]
MHQKAPRQLREVRTLVPRSLAGYDTAPTPPVPSYHITNPTTISLLPVLDGTSSHPACLPAAVLPPSKLLSLSPGILLDIASLLPVRKILNLYVRNRYLRFLLHHQLIKAVPQYRDQVLMLSRRLLPGTPIGGENVTLIITLHHPALLYDLFASRPNYPSTCPPAISCRCCTTPRHRTLWDVRVYCCARGQRWTFWTRPGTRRWITRCAAGLRDSENADCGGGAEGAEGLR